MPHYTRLSCAIENIADHYAVVVVGSGYGGAIAASRMARAGQQVCLLERGKERLPGEFPETEHEAIAEMQVDLPGQRINPQGLFDMRFYDEINVLVGCGLGGTSLVNANVSIRADPRVFEDKRWPEPLRADVATRLEDGYQRAREMLRPGPVPEAVQLGKLRAQQASADKIGAPLRRADLNVTFVEPPGGVNPVGVPQAACNHCGDCVTGCNYGSKNTTLMTYLPDAVNHGAEIYTAVEVRRISRSDSGAYLVHYRILDARRELFDAPDQTVSADLVIVSAGTLGSTEILLRSQAAGLATSPRIGEGFTGNGDVLGFAYNCDQPINGVGWGHRKPAHMKRGSSDGVGPCITSYIDLRATDDPNHGMIIEEGSLPGPVAALLTAPLAAAADLFGVDTDQGIADNLGETARELVSAIGGAHHGAMRNTQTYLVMSHEDTSGRMALVDDRVRVSWAGIGDEPVFDRVNQRLIEATTALGGTFVRNPLWTELFKHHLFTVHPLGGCVMADSAATGAVNHKGQVFAGALGTGVHDGLYVSDGSIIPRSLGANPLLTISALAERTCALIAADRGWTIDYTLPSIPRLRPQARVETLGVEFTERMAGHFSTRVLDDFLCAEQDGRASGSSFEVILTIVSDDVARLVTDETYESRMVGTARAPALSAQPLSVTDGRFILLSSDPDHPGGKNMHYRMKMTSHDGNAFWLEGTKYIKDDPGLDLWSDCTTLYITVSQGGAPGGERLGCGVLHISPRDLLKQLRTARAVNAHSTVERLTAVARFGAYFASNLWNVYGGVFARPTVFALDARPRKRRALRTAAPEIDDFATPDGTTLRLTRYHGGSKGPVMLAHDLGVSSLMFSIDTIETNLLEYLFERGYDVWLLDYRASIERPAHQQPYTGDTIADQDFPAAVARVCGATGARSVQVVAHGFGAITFTMAMLAGLEGVRSAVLSQLSTHIATPAFPPTAFEESCDSAVCQRIAGLYGPVYAHDQLNPATHDAMHELFGDTSTSALEHLARMARAKHLVRADGSERYLDRLTRLAIPTTFLHGAENRSFLPRSTEETLEVISRANGAGLYRRHVVAGYGHGDCMFGKNAARDVYPFIVDHLEATR